jgi:hypothetical protein
VTKELVLVRDVLDCHVQVRGVEGGYGADPDALDRVGGGVVPPAEVTRPPALELVDALKPTEVRLLLLHAAIVAAAAATARATMTGFGKRRMRLSSPEDAGISAVTAKGQTSAAGNALHGPRKFMFIFRNFPLS